MVTPLSPARWAVDFHVGRPGSRAADRTARRGGWGSFAFRRGLLEAWVRTSWRLGPATSHFDGHGRAQTHYLADDVARLEAHPRTILPAGGLDSGGTVLLEGVPSAKGTTAPAQTWRSRWREVGQGQSRCPPPRRDAGSPSSEARMNKSMLLGGRCWWPPGPRIPWRWATFSRLRLFVDYVEGS